MKVLEVRNVIEALPLGLQLLKDHGDLRGSRNGEVMIYPGPVTTVYQQPMERVLFWDDRDANPFFHLHESLWMLGGRKDVESVAKFVKHMETFSDDGKTFHAAYGYRWRYHFGFDQLDVIIKRLRKDPDDRRSVLEVWRANDDLGVPMLDIPCNTQAYFTRNYLGDLDMMVTCRSNDIIWGAYGANAVHWSFLQEYMSAMIGCGIGSYWQVSNNYHAYTKVADPLLEKFKTSSNVMVDPYRTGNVQPMPLFEGVSVIDEPRWHQELHAYLDEVSGFPFRIPFFKDVAMPMRYAYISHKGGQRNESLQWMGHLVDCDWKVAGTEWLVRRHISEAKTSA